MKSNITHIFHVRLDTEERRQNLINIIVFFSKYSKENDIPFIFIEDDTEPRFKEVYDTYCHYLSPNSDYRFRLNEGIWQKCKSFNYGLSLVKTDYAVFHDVDAILNPQQIFDSVTELQSDSEACLCYPYNGYFICLSFKLKREFENEGYQISTLLSHYKPGMPVNWQDENILVGHYNSVGGCVVAKVDLFRKCGGYNENFIGWGYEDNEIGHRVYGLGYKVVRLSDLNSPLFHMPHSGEGASPREHNPYYEHNRAECTKIEKMGFSELKEYIQTWKNE